MELLIEIVYELSSSGDWISYYLPVIKIKVLNETLLIINSSNIAEKLNINEKKYINIKSEYLKSDNALEENLFKTYEGCKKFIDSKELEPYLVMVKLIG